MKALAIARTDDDTQQPEPALQQPPPLLQDIDALASLLSRSIPSLRRDDAAGRLPQAVRLGGSKRWRRAEIEAWIEAGCPERERWSAMRQ
jgi:predicted DNA-binding transcriptional regulator AlpA